MIKGNREGTSLRGSFRAHTVYCASTAGSSGELGTEKTPRFCLQNCSIWLSTSIRSVLILSCVCAWKTPAIRNSSNKPIMTRHAFKISVDIVIKPTCLRNWSYQMEDSNSCSPHGRLRSKCDINGQYIFKRNHWDLLAWLSVSQIHRERKEHIKVYLS